MTISTHTYSAEIIGTPSKPLALKAGTVSLDSARWPHITGQATVAVSDPALLASLDPRTGVRVKITAAAVFPTFSQSRVFDLGVRRAQPNRASGDVTLQLASDEALLQDYAPLTLDKGARAYETSLRSVVGYVLGKIGATLQAGTDDANVTAYWAVTNLLTNPSFETNLTGWTVTNGTSFGQNAAAAPVAGSWAARYLTTVANTASYINSAQFSVSPGDPITASAYMIATGARPCRALIRFYDAANTIIRDSWGAYANCATGTWTRISNIGVIAPDGAQKASVHFEYFTDVVNRTVWTDCAMAYVGDELVAYHDGATPATAAYTYTWSGDPHASTSTRRPVISRPPEVFSWQPGTGGLDFLSPLLQSVGLRLVCDEQRRWTLRGDDYSEDGLISLRYGINIITADEEISRESDDWFDACVIAYEWQDPAGQTRTATDSYALPGATKTLRREIRAPFPGPGRAEWSVKRAQGKGRTVTVGSVADWTARCEQLLAITLEGDPLQAGEIESIEFDLGTDRMKISSRTADIPDSAWSLIPVGEKWNDAPVGASWIGEAI